MKNSNIEWTDHTWNIAAGCTKVDADCKFCYMYRDSMNDTRYDPKTVRKTRTVFNLPLKIKEPSRIFTSSLTDFFHPDIDAYRHEAWDIIRRCPQHTFQILTKRPERIADHLPEDWGDGWDNVWLGTSVGSNKGIGRINEIINLTTKDWKCIFFISIEPLYEKPEIPFLESLKYFDWVIVGGESGNEKGNYRYRQCELEWIEAIIEECEEFGVPVFVKQLGTHLSKTLGLKDRHGKDISQWPEQLQIRQFTEGYRLPF
jgi:protein gp37